MISTKFIKSSLIYSLIGSLPLFSGFILLPFYTNLLSTADFGNLTLYVSITFAVQVLANFGFDSYIGVYYYDCKNDKQKLKDNIGTVVASLVIIGAGLTLISLFLGEPLFNVLFRDSSLSFFPYGLMSVLTGIFNSFFRTYANLLVNQQKPERFFWVNSFNFAITILISLAGIFLYPYTLIGPMWGRLLSGVLIFILALYFFIHEFGFRIKKELFKTILNFCLPLLAYSALLWIVNYIDRFIINDYFNPTEVAIYDFGLKCIIVVDFFQNGLTAAIYPKVFDIWVNNTSRTSTVEVNRYFSGFTAVSILLIPFVIFIMPLALPAIITNKDFYIAFGFLPLLAVQFVFRGLMSMYLAPVYFYKKTKVLPIVFFIAAVLQVGLGIFLIRQLGIMGAVWTLVIIKPVQVLLLYFASNRYYHFKINLLKFILLPLLFSAFIVAIYFLPLFTQPHLNNLAILAFSVIIVSIAYRNEVRLLVRQLLQKK
ncbi:MAG: oligosaccharide flippase family protein [Bacteroidota bacterium]